MSNGAPAHTKFQKDPYLSDCRKLSFKLIKDLYIDMHTEPNRKVGGNSLEVVGVLKVFLTITTLVKNLKSTIN